MRKRVCGKGKLEGKNNSDKFHTKTNKQRNATKKKKLPNRWFLKAAVASTDCDYKRSAAAKRESRIHLDTGQMS